MSSIVAPTVARANDPYDSMTPGDTHTLRLFWTDYVLIVSTVLIFFSYGYSLRGKRHINRFFPRVLRPCPGLLLITVAAKYIDEQIKFASIFIASGSSLVYKPFVCVGAETTILQPDSGEYLSCAVHRNFLGL
ncbi:hypothetical protein BKA57DRAFT_511721 [Linnemannia elongata]|nr:hypothetical protein BKA57DRAFT_511721 [Linnemannia elongata]